MKRFHIIVSNDKNNKRSNPFLCNHDQPMKVLNKNWTVNSERSTWRHKPFTKKVNGYISLMNATWEHNLSKSRTNLSRFRFLYVLTKSCVLRDFQTPTVVSSRLQQNNIKYNKFSKRISFLAFGIFNSFMTFIHH